MPEETKTPAETALGAVYFTAPDGVVYRVLDTAWRHGRIVAANPPASWATTRVFRAEDGTRRFYPLAFLELHAETREPRPDWLRRQCEASEARGTRKAQSLAARSSKVDGNRSVAPRPSET